jgi:hypothetical protein
MDKIGFNIINLIVPTDPPNLIITGSNGNWEFRRHSRYAETKLTLNSKVHSGITYFADHDDLGISSDTVILDELMNLCLTLSYLTSNTVTINQTTVYSRISFLSLNDGYPREKGITGIRPVVNNDADITQATNLMLAGFNQNKTDYHVNVIIHYWLDALSCWSLENLFLSACTILEIIKQAERRRIGDPSLHFFDAISSVSTNLAIPQLNRDWLNMRNDLTHEGHLSKVRFPNKTKGDCIMVCEDVLQWIDEFIHKIFALGPIKGNRFCRGALNGLNSYTTWV